MKLTDATLAERLQAALEGKLPPDRDSTTEPLANLAHQLRQMPRLEPRGGAIERCLARLDRESLRGHKRPTHSSRRGWIATLASACAVLLLVVAVATARSTLPGHPLYPVKRAAEDVRLMLTRNSEGRVEYCVCMSQRRMIEFVTQAKSGEVDAATLGAMLNSSQRAQLAAERASDPKRDVLVTQVGQLCEAQGLMLEDVRSWISVKDTALISAAISNCALRGQACCACPSHTK